MAIAMVTAMVGGGLDVGLNVGIGGIRGRAAYADEATQAEETTKALDSRETRARERTRRANDAAARSRTAVTHNAVWKTHAKPRQATVRRAGVVTRSKAYAFRQVARRSWPGQQFQCLDSLWTRESNWNHRAYNHSSGAYGIPQALPGGKMALVALDWRLNPHTQIRWGLKYIKGRYGSPCGAWGHFQSHNWY